MARYFLLFVSLVVLMASGGSVVRADPSPTASARASADGDAGIRAKNAGTIDGDVVAVDYHAGTIAVQSGGRRIDVVVLPSTNIQGNDNFHTIADIKRGSHVSIILSRRAGTFIAQIIRLR